MRFHHLWERGDLPMTFVVAKWEKGACANQVEEQKASVCRAEGEAMEKMREEKDMKERENQNW